MTQPGGGAALRSVLFLTQSGETLPSVRFRVLPFIEAGRAAGLDIGWRRIPKSFLKRLPFLLFLPERDVIVIQKKLFSGFELSLIRRRCRKLVFDFDETLWATRPGERDSAAARRRVRKAAARFAAVLPRVDAVIACNRFLADEAVKHRVDVSVIPTPIDTDVYVPPSERRPRPDGRVEVGWMGTEANLFFLPEIFQSLARHSGELHCNVVADRKFTEKYPTAQDFQLWDPQSEVERLQAMDIGLMPLTDDPYTHGKCGFKILQYMACGAVTVASDVGFNREIVEHGADGFLVQRPEDWERYVLMLARDHDLRSRMAGAARAKVEREFSLKALGDRFLGILKMD